MTKNKKISYVMNDLKLSNFLHLKTSNMDSYSKLSKNCKFSNFTNSHAGQTRQQIRPREWANK